MSTKQVMAFGWLQKFGKEKLEIIINQLISGASPKAVARTIQVEWGDARDFSSGTLERQLNTLRKAINHGSFGGNSRTQQLPRPSAHGLRLKPIDELKWLVKISEERIVRLRTMEIRQDKLNPELTKALKNRVRMLMVLQKMRFELGLDEYKKVTLSRREREAAIAHAKEQYDRENYKQIQEAVQTAEKILEANRSKLRARGREEETVQ